MSASLFFKPAIDPPNPRPIFALHDSSKTEFLAEFGVAHPDTPVQPASRSSPWLVFSSQSQSMSQSFSPLSPPRLAEPVKAPREAAGDKPRSSNTRPPLSLFGGTVEVVSTKAQVQPAVPTPAAPVAPPPAAAEVSSPTATPASAPARKRKRLTPDPTNSPILAMLGATSTTVAQRMVSKLPFLDPSQLPNLSEECTSASFVSILLLGCLQTLSSVYGVAIGLRVAERLRTVHWVRLDLSRGEDVGLTWLLGLLSSSGPRKVCFNAQASLRCLARASPLPSTLPDLVDPMIAGWMLKPDASTVDLELDALLALHRVPRTPGKPILNHGTSPVGSADGTGTAVSVDSVRDHLVLVEALADVVTKALSKLQLERPFTNQEMPLVSVLAEMGAHGIGFLSSAAVEASTGIQSRLAALEREAHELVGEEFSLTSSTEVAHVLYDKLKLAVPSTMPGASPWKQAGVSKRHQSTSQEVLDALNSQHPLPRIISTHRKLSKVQSTYIAALVDHAVLSDRSARYMIHTSFNQCSTGTGRLSSSSPNLQSIPTTSGGVMRTVGGADVDDVLESLNIRQWFTPTQADYSQIEVRVLAHMSGDPHLCSMFRTAGSDVYVAMAAQVFGVSESAVTEVQRKQAKTVCLGIIYGIGAQEAARKLSVPLHVASKLRSQFLSRYPLIGKFMDQVKEYLRSNGYVVTLTGRRRYLPDITHADEQKRLYAERQAVNSVIQGTASDLMKIAMVLLRRMFLYGEPCPPPDVVDIRIIRGAALVLQIHDELIVECVGIPDVIAAVGRCVKWCMEDLVPVELMKAGAEAAWDFRVPLVVCVEVGNSWGSMSPLF